MSKDQLDGESRVLAALASDRQQWVNLGAPDEKRRVRFLRPEEADFSGFRAGVNIEHVCRYVNGWEGFSEATFLGAAVGASDELPFSPALWAAYARDHSDESSEVAQEIAKAISARVQARNLGAKN